MAYDLVIKDAIIHDGFQHYVADVGIEGEKIAAIGHNLASKSSKNEIAANGLWLLPGFIDVHTHFALRVGNNITTCDDFWYGSKSAAYGGVTTIIDFLAPANNKSLRDTFLERFNEAFGKCAIDFSFHACLGSEIDVPLQDFQWAFDNGITSVKIFTAYSKRNLMQTDENIYKILEKAKETKMLVTVHAENDNIINLLEKKIEKDKNHGINKNIYSNARYLSETRPISAEIEAASRVALLANEVKTPVYIVHLSSGISAQHLAYLRKTHKFPVLIETCPQYIYLTDDKFDSLKDGHYYTCCPPIRSAQYQHLLLNYISSNDIQVVATDHCAFSKVDKDKAKNNIRAMPMGLPGVETLGMLTLNLALQNKLDLNIAIRTITYNPAKLFGLYPQKGCILPGSDADLVLFDPTKHYMISVHKLHGKCDFCPFDGIEVWGTPVMTISRGKILVQDGNWLGEASWGKFVKRKQSNYLEWLKQNNFD